MDYGEKIQERIPGETPDSLRMNNLETLNQYTPEISSESRRAIGRNAIFSSQDENEEKNSPEIEILPTDPAELVAKDEKPEYQLIFNPDEVRPENGDNIGQSALKEIQTVIERTDKYPVQEFANYQAMRRLYNKKYAGEKTI